MSSVVYFVQIGKHVKIGMSTNIARRLKSFATTTVNAEVLLTIPGGRELERQLHGLLREAHITRELFHNDYRVSSFIGAVKYRGLAYGIEFLEQTTPARRQQYNDEQRGIRVHENRMKKAELDAYYASLVADRKQRLGW